MDIYAPFVQRVGKFNVVRDDVFTGGTKARVLTNLLADVKETEIIYAADRYGYAGLALAQACMQHDKKAVIFFNDDSAKPKPFLETCDHPAAEIKIMPNTERQIDLFSLAEEFAQKAKHRKIYPVGFCTQKFQSALTRYARALPVKPKENLGFSRIRNIDPQFTPSVAGSNHSRGEHGFSANGHIRRRSCLYGSRNARTGSRAEAGLSFCRPLRCKNLAFCRKTRIRRCAHLERRSLGSINHDKQNSKITLR